MVEAETEYSGLYGLAYLSTVTSESWPNNSMAPYFGVQSILGVENEE